MSAAEKEQKGPDGFKVTSYPDVTAEKDVPLYVCQTCRPQWDTFDPKAAEAHTANGIHYPQLAVGGEAT